ncbi:hypothetical protein [Aequorivita viscosa]|uniref:Uncharacterized protein n=1 Tax=Aequorivita viscosa TaxID=797419 RepID=A0A1M6C6K4_9FLAO|nr:hypothetical protein [Aequorivita viscosa]SDW24103.1 hypothetical protein SAMN05216556_103144 [Aequorivita viscosa]SHI56431.1 hypothetical protein SAMN04487908_103144 [Aequorivita viscosa]
MIQLNKPLTVVIALLSLGALGFNLYENPDVSRLLGKEVNNWLYRGFWLLIIGVCIYNYIYIDRNTLKNKSKSKPKSSLGSAREPKVGRNNERQI